MILVGKLLVNCVAGGLQFLNFLLRIANFRNIGIADIIVRHFLFHHHLPFAVTSPPSQVKKYRPRFFCASHFALSVNVELNESTCF